MPLFVTVTPGTTITANTTLDASTLNLLGTPSVEVTGSVDGGSLSLGAGSVGTSALAANAVTNAKLAQMTGPSLKGVQTGTNDPSDIAVDNSTLEINTTLRVKDRGVTYAKLPAVDATSVKKLLGRHTASSGSIEEVTVGTGLTLDASTGVLSSSAVSISKYTTSAKALPTDGNSTQLVQWLTSSSELPAIAYAPQMIRVVLVCQGSTDSPFVAGNEIPVDACVMQAYTSNFPIYSYPIGVSSGVVTGTNIFLNVVFSATTPGNGTPYTSAASVGSKLLTLKNNDGTYLTLTRSNWKVKAYLLYDSTWA